MPLGASHGAVARVRPLRLPDLLRRLRELGCRAGERLARHRSFFRERHAPGHPGHRLEVTSGRVPLCSGVQARPGWGEHGRRVKRTSTREDRWDLVPVGVATGAACIGLGYVLLMKDQGDSPASWFLGGLIVAASLAAYAAVRSLPRRSVAMAASAAILLPLGFLGLFSIGLPVLVAGVFAVGFAARGE